MPTLILQGKSGEKYSGFEIFEKNDDDILECGAIYVFLHKKENNKYQILYIGQSKNPERRMSDHEKWPCVTRHGCTHIAIKKTPGGKTVRCNIEKDLIQHYNPPCNKQLVCN